MNAWLGYYLSVINWLIMSFTSARGHKPSRNHLSLKEQVVLQDTTNFLNKIQSISYLP